MTWKLKTLQDEPGFEHNPLVRCPYCNCECFADQLVDATVQPSKIRKKNETHHCHVCRERMFNAGVVTREEYIQAHNPPQQLVEKMRHVDKELKGGSLQS